MLLIFWRSYSWVCWILKAAHSKSRYLSISAAGPRFLWRSRIQELLGAQIKINIFRWWLKRIEELELRWKSCELYIRISGRVVQAHFLSRAHQIFYFWCKDRPPPVQKIHILTLVPRLGDIPANAEIFLCRITSCIKAGDALLVAKKKLLIFSRLRLWHLTYPSNNRYETVLSNYLINKESLVPRGRFWRKWITISQTSFVDSMISDLPLSNSAVYTMLWAPIWIQYSKLHLFASNRKLSPSWIVGYAHTVAVLACFSSDDEAPKEDERIFHIERSKILLVQIMQRSAKGSVISKS